MPSSSSHAACLASACRCLVGAREYEKSLSGQRRVGSSNFQMAQPHTTHRAARRYTALCVEYAMPGHEVWIDSSIGQGRRSFVGRKHLQALSHQARMTRITQLFRQMTCHEQDSTRGSASISATSKSSVGSTVCRDLSSWNSHNQPPDGSRKIILNASCSSLAMTGRCSTVGVHQAIVPTPSIATSLHQGAGGKTRPMLCAEGNQQTSCTASASAEGPSRYTCQNGNLARTVKLARNTMQPILHALRSYIS